MAAFAKTQSRLLLAATLLLPIAAPMSARQAPASERSSASPQLTLLSAESLNDLDRICSNLADALEQRKYPTVAVFGASWDVEPYTELGDLIGAAVTERLASKAAGFKVVAREQLRVMLAADGISPLMADVTSSAQWLAQDLKIPAAVSVTLSVTTNSSITVNIGLDLDKGWFRKYSSDRKFEIPLSQPLIDSLRKSLLTPGLIADPKMNPDTPASAGVLPQCIECPRPEYPREAQEAHWSGDFRVSATVETDGTAKEILILKTAPYYVDRQSIHLIKTWKFKPARDAAGNPIAKRVQLLITLDVY